MHRQVLQWPRAAKRSAVVLVDVILALVAMWMAFSLRLEVWHWPTGTQVWAYILGPVIAIPIFVRLGLYRAIFRYTGVDALYAISKGIALYALLLYPLLYWLFWPSVPRSIGILQPIFFLLLVSVSRALARFWLAGFSTPRRHPNQARMLIFGAGVVGVQTAAAIAMTRQFKLLGFVDEDPAKIGRTINDLPIFSPAQVPAMVDKLAVTDILLAIPSASRERRNRIIHSLRHLPVHTRTLPGLTDLASGRVTVRDFRELDVEDLLGREAVKPQANLLASSLQNQTILVSGAGGSIGSELCRQILSERPKQLVLLDHSEYALYTLHRELQALCDTQYKGVLLVPVLGSVVNKSRLAWVFATYRPATVYHAAAYKHEIGRASCRERVSSKV